MRTIILIIISLALPAFPQMLQGIVGGKVSVAAAPTAPTIVQAGNCLNASGNNCTITLNGVATGNHLFAAIKGSGDGTLTTITVTGTGSTFSTTVNPVISRASEVHQGTLLATSVTGGNVTYTCTFNSATVIRCVIIEIASGSGSFAKDVVAGANAAGGASLSSGATADTANDNELVIAVGSVFGTYTLSKGSGYSDITNGASGTNFLTEQKTTTSKGAQTGTMTNSSAIPPWIMQVATFK